MIKAVIFDFFGVLALRDSASFRQTFYADNPEKVAQTKKVQNQLGLGQIGYDDFISALAKIGGVDREEVLKYTEEYQPNLELLNYIRDQLKPNYKLGIISNAGADWVQRILGQDNQRLFDNIILSYMVGFIKPDSEIYEMSANNLGVKEEECVFIDDILTYCQGAEATGMSTIWYQDFGQMKTELEKILAASSDN
ncbi:HAD-IA family hydrolase [Candidatus Saccharibacteria bacterium]|nr:HAD-IA family hydrolase [Candidatus Saccharibacteria bacterium]